MMFHLMCVHIIFNFVSVAEIAAHSADHMFPFFLKFV